MAEDLKQSDRGCFQKAVEKDEQTFTLRAQDLSAPTTVCFWILVNIGTAPEDKLRRALDEAIAMRNHPPGLKKVAD